MSLSASPNVEVVAKEVTSIGRLHLINYQRQDSIFLFIISAVALGQCRPCSMQDDGRVTSMTVTPKWSFEVPYQDGRKMTFMGFFLYW